MNCDDFCFVSFTHLYNYNCECFGLLLKCFLFMIFIFVRKKRNKKKVLYAFAKCCSVYCFVFLHMSLWCGQNFKYSINRVRENMLNLFFKKFILVLLSLLCIAQCCWYSCSNCTSVKISSTMKEGRPSFMLAQVGL